MENKTKKTFLLVLLGIVTFVLLMKFSDVLNFLGSILDLVMPIIVGAILAIFITVPMNGIRKLLVLLVRKIRSKNKKIKRPPYMALHIASFVITIICVVIVISLVLILLVPEIISSMQSLYDQIIKKLSELGSMNFEEEWLNDLVARINWEETLKKITDNVSLIAGNIITSISSTVNVLITTVFAIIISIYMSLGKDNLRKDGNKLIRAYFKPDWAKKVLRFGRMFSVQFAKFLSGQCTEAIILGFLLALAFLIFKLPYAWLGGLLTAVCALIPYVGAALSCVVIAFLTLIIDPTLVIRCVIVYLVVQFIETQFIYPRVVGDSVGLPPLYTLIAALIGGNIFGIMGIIFSIPLTSVIVELVKEDVAKRLNDKKAVANSESDIPNESPQ